MADKMFNNSKFTFIGEFTVGKKGGKVTSVLKEGGEIEQNND